MPYTSLHEKQELVQNTDEVHIPLITRKNESKLNK